MSRRSDEAPREGIRERKRRETLQRIVDAGVTLFIEKGYDAATLDEIAEHAGISRRTFFHYFKSKDEILLSLQDGVGERIAEAVRTAAADGGALDAVRDAVVSVCSTIPVDDMIVIDRLMRSNVVVQARKQASYVRHEQTLFEALRVRWPQPERETGLRLTAMMSIGAMRIASEALGREGQKRSYVALLNEAFDALKAEV